MHPMACGIRDMQKSAPMCRVKSTEQRSRSRSLSRCGTTTIGVESVSRSALDRRGRPVEIGCGRRGNKPSAQALPCRGLARSSGRDPRPVQREREALPAEDAACFCDSTCRLRTRCHARERLRCAASSGRGSECGTARSVGPSRRRSTHSFVEPRKDPATRFVEVFDEGRIAPERAEG